MIISLNGLFRIFSKLNLTFEVSFKMVDGVTMVILEKDGMAIFYSLDHSMLVRMRGEGSKELHRALTKAYNESKSGSTNHILSSSAES